MKRNNTLLIILAITLLTRLVFAFGWHEIWWDSGVYIGMGKYLYSGGESGLWEHIRPPLVPIVLGFFWKIGLSPIIFGRIFEIMLMIGVVWLTYRLARHWWEEKTAIIASLIIALSPIFYYLNFHLYTEIPATFFVLLSLWLFVKEKYAWSGISAGLAFLAKFPAGMFVVILLFILLPGKKWRQFFTTGAGFGIIALPYFLYSLIAYGNPFATVLAASYTIKNVLGCNVLRYKPWWQYGWWLVFSETKLHFLAIPGIIALWKKWKKQHVLFALSLAIPALYFMQLHCRDYRYLTLFLPFAAMITALGIVWIYEQLKIKKKKVFIVAAIILGAWMLYASLVYYYSNEAQQPDVIAEEYFRFLEDKTVAGEVWTANPIIAANTDAKLMKIYYPVFNADVSQDFTAYIAKHHDRINAVFLDNCGGGIICPPDDSICESRNVQLIKELDTHFTRVFDKQSGRCWYRIWAISSN